MQHIDWDQPFRAALTKYQAEVDADDAYQAAREDYFEENPDASDADWDKYNQDQMEYAAEQRAERDYELRRDEYADMYP